MPALFMYMPYTAIQFTVLHKLKSFAAGSSKTGLYFLLRSQLVFSFEVSVSFVII